MFNSRRGFIVYPIIIIINSIISILLLLQVVIVIMNDCTTTITTTTTITSTRITVVNAWNIEWVQYQKNHHHNRKSPLPPQDVTTTTTSSSSKFLPRKSGHMSFISTKNDDGIPYVFGGYVEEDNINNNNDNKQQQQSPLYHRYATNDLWKYNSIQQQWEQVITTGDVPVDRLVGTISLVVDDNKEYAYLIGGWNSNAKDPTAMFLDTVHRYDLQTNVWKLLPVIIPDGPCSRHIAVTIPNTNKILIHNHRCIDYIWIYNTDTNIFSKQPTTGTCPTSRGLHCATIITAQSNDENTKLVIFGGAEQSGIMSNEIFILNLQTWVWYQCQPDNANIKLQPTPRAGASMCTIDKDHVLVYGGAQRSNDTNTGLQARGDIWLFNIPTEKWILLDNDNNNGDPNLLVPPPRNAASLVPFHYQPETNDQKQQQQQPYRQFMLIGGWSPFQRTYNDDYILNLYK